MASLTKGNRVDLTKGHSGLDNLLVGLGWDPDTTKSRNTFDLDAFAFLLDKNGKLKGLEDVVSYSNLSHKSGALKHTGDNLTGDGDGDDEQILVCLSKIPADIDRVVFAVNIYDANRKGQDFSMVEKASIRIANQAGGDDLVRYNLSDNYKGQDVVVAGEIYRKDGEWKFYADGTGSTASSIESFTNRYR